ncbi:hypothetical protein WDU94_012372, partial [Cyamophila willieti]
YLRRAQHAGGRTNKPAPVNIQSLGTRIDQQTRHTQQLHGHRFGQRNQLRQHSKKQKEDTLRIGILNVLTLKNKVEECIDVLIERKLDILGLSEVKRKGNGMEELRAGFHIFWSGGNEAKYGVAIIVSNDIKNCITEVNNISDRLMKINIKLRDDTITILQCYTPQTGCPDSEKQEFENLLESHLRGDKCIVMGDMNAQVGSNRTSYETIMGPWGYGNRNLEGERLIDLCIRNELIIGNTWYKKRESHKITRYSWDGRLKTMIDFFLVSDNIKPWLNNVKVIPSVSLGSDHRLVVSCFKVKKLKPMNISQDKKIKSYKLKDIKHAEEFRAIVSQGMPQCAMRTIEEEWTNFKKVIVSAAEKVCGRNNEKRKYKETPWWNNETKNATTTKNNAFRTYFENRTQENRQKYKEAKAEAERVIQREMRKWFEEWGKKVT